jgi:dTDP-4-amino-4,6-dideoxygalactose transaminase
VAHVTSRRAWKRDLVEEFWDAAALAACRASASADMLDEFLDEFRRFLGATGRVWATRSGTDALRQFLGQAVPLDRRHVLVCSFNCRVVADAVLDAGLEVETFDLDDASGRIDWEAVADRLSPRHGAIVIPHLFGVPADFRPIRSAARRAGVLILEDCAHTLGGTLADATAGTLGDAAVFSFNYDKPISLGGGGLLLVNDAALSRRIRVTTPVPGIEREEEELKTFLRYLERRRRLSPRGANSRIVRRAFRRAATLLRRSVSGWGLGRSWPAPFPVSGFGPLRASLGCWQLRRYADILRERNANAAYFTTRTGCTWFTAPAATPAWLKQKAVPPGGNASALSRRLRRQGLPVAAVNWAVTIDRYLGRPERPNAAYVAAHSLDIPVHQNVEPGELDAICRVFAEEGAAARGRR